MTSNTSNKGLGAQDFQGTGTGHLIIFWGVKLIPISRSSCFKTFNYKSIPGRLQTQPFSYASRSAQS